jgi:hypothetical protein
MKLTRLLLVALGLDQAVGQTVRDLDQMQEGVRRLNAIVVRLAHSLDELNEEVRRTSIILAQKRIAYQQGEDTN